MGDPSTIAKQKDAYMKMLDECQAGNSSF